MRVQLTIRKRRIADTVTSLAERDSISKSDAVNELLEDWERRGEYIRKLEAMIKEGVSSDARSRDSITGANADVSRHTQGTGDGARPEVLLAGSDLDFDA